MLGLFLCAAALFQAEPDLIAKSTVLLNPGHWTEYWDTVPQYRWVNSHEIIYSVGNGMTIPYTARPWYSIDVGTQKVSEIAGLADGSLGFRLYGAPLPDPSGTRLLFDTQDDRWKPIWVLTTLNGKKVASWPRHAAKVFMSLAGQDQSWDEWSLDGNSIIESEPTYEGSKLALHVWRREMSNLSKEIAYPTLPVESKPEDRATALDLGNGGAAWIEDRMYLPPERQVVLQWQLALPSKALKTSFVVPKDWGGWLPTVSPDHKHALWEAWNQKNFTVSLWVSQIDCTDLHEIGVVHLDPRLVKTGRPGFGEVHWIPGRSAASFYFAGAIREIEVH